MSSAAAPAFDPKTTHVITLESDPTSSISKFSIHDADGNTLWSGITLNGPCETQFGTWSGMSLKSLSTIVQKLYLVEKIKADRIEKNAIHLSLSIDAQYELPLDTERYKLTDHSELNVLLWREEIEGNEQEKENAGISTGTGRRPVCGIRLGEGEATGLVERAHRA